MVGDFNKQRLHVVLTGDAAEVRPDSLFDVLVDPGFAILSAEDDVIVQGCERVGHARTISQIVPKNEWEIVSPTNCAFRIQSQSDDVRVAVGFNPRVDRETHGRRVATHERLSCAALRHCCCAPTQRPESGRRRCNSCAPGAPWRSFITRHLFSADLAELFAADDRLDRSANAMLVGLQLIAHLGYERAVRQQDAAAQ